MNCTLQYNNELVKKQNEKGLKIIQLRENLISKKIKFEEVVGYPTEGTIVCFKFLFDNKCIYLSLSANDNWYISDKKQCPSYVFYCSHEHAINNIDWNDRLKSFFFIQNTKI